MLDPRQDTLPISREPWHVLQAATCHVGTVKDLKDPKRRGRVRVEVPNLFDDKSAKCWSNWCEMSWMPGCNARGNGDTGIWWSPVPREMVLVAFPGGDYAAPPIVFPFSAWQATEKDKQEMIPAEAKAMSDQDIRKGTRVRMLKSEAGHTLLMDDNGGEETMALLDWTGAGWFSIAPGKEEDERERSGEESKWRKGAVRGAKSVMALTSEKPSELLDEGWAITGDVDLNGQGILRWAEDGKGKVIIGCAKEIGKTDGPCIVMDSENEILVLSVGKAQLVVNGKRGHVEVTRQIIQEQPKIDIGAYFNAFWERIQRAFERYKNYKAPMVASSGVPNEVTYT